MFFFGGHMDRLVKPGGVHEPLHVGSDIFLDARADRKGAGGVHEPLCVGTGCLFLFLKGHEFTPARGNPCHFWSLPGRGSQIIQKLGGGSLPHIRSAFFRRETQKNVHAPTTPPTLHALAAHPCRRVQGRRPQAPSSHRSLLLGILAPESQDTRSSTNPDPPWDAACPHHGFRSKAEGEAFEAGTP